MVLRVAMAQIDPVVGDIAGNVERCLGAIETAEVAGADLCVFPELVVTGYPPEDLLLRDGFIAENERAVEEIAAATRGCAAVVGYVERLAAPSSGAPRALGGPPRLANAAALCADGRVVGIYEKRCLPNYGVFDEQRWFMPGSAEPVLYRVAGALVGLTICEDLWTKDGPAHALGVAGAQVVVALNASPFARGVRDRRVEMLRALAAETRAAAVYVNQVGGQDELVFDGASVIVTPGGELVAAGPQFSEAVVVADVEVAERDGAPRVPVVEVERTSHRTTRPALGAASDVAGLGPVEEVYEALVLGTRDYLSKNGFGGAIVGLSGGIDSSLVAAIAADALGPERVRGLAMPSRYSSEASVDDARLLSSRLGIELSVVPIDDAHRCVARVVEAAIGAAPEGVTDENLQSRLRGVVLMAVSNSTGRIVLTTGNKSETATGYSTLYGDTAGGLAVIKDVPKTLVYELCGFRNARAVSRGDEEPIPRSVLEKPPSAELRPDQRDDQSLPPYDQLDPLLEAYVELDRTAAELRSQGFDPALVDRVVNLVDGAEYKRRQSAPGIRITQKAFGRDRRVPITNAYRTPPRSASAETETGASHA